MQDIPTFSVYKFSIFNMINHRVFLIWSITVIAQIYQVQPLITGVLVVFQIIYMPCYKISDENVTECVAEKTGEGNTWQIKCFCLCQCDC